MLSSYNFNFQLPYFTLIMLKIQKYFPQEYIVELKLQFFWIGSIKKSETSQALQKLKGIEAMNINEYSHLKRIRKKSQQSDETDILLCPQNKEELKEKVTEVLGQMLTKIWVQDVPISSPCTKQQFTQWCKIWPINFIQQEIYKQIKHSKQEVQFLQHILAKNSKEVIIFNDKMKPLLVQQIGKLCQQGTIQHAVMQILEAWPHKKQFEELPNAYYLTKLRIYCSIPICGMCAMALVHSRLQRIYFPATQDIRQISDIMCCSKLNHRIKIFQISKNP